MTKSLACLLLGGLVSHQLAAAPAVVDDFNRDDPGFPASAAATVSLVDAGDGPGSGRALAIAWPSPHRLWVECDYQQPRPVAGLGAGAGVVIELDVWLPPSPSVVQVGLHLRDAGDETFQWSVKVPPSSAGGWRTLGVAIDPASPEGHWGGRANGRIDFPLKLGGYAVVFAHVDVPAGRVLVKQVRAVPLPGVSLDTDRFPALVNASGDYTCSLVVTNSGDKEVAVTLKGRLSGFDGAAGDVAGAATVPAGGFGRIPLALPDRRPGIRWLDGALTFDGRAMAHKTAFVIADPVVRRRTTDDFLFGICSHPERHPADVQEAEFRAAAAAGASVMRVSIAWATLEPKPGEWRWDAQDRLVDLAAKYGIETQPILGFGPAHATSPELQAEQTEAYRTRQADAWKITLFGPPEEARWRRYVAAMAGRYRGRIRFYEVWNEPDLSFWRGTTDEYLRILRAASDELRRADPSAKLLSGGFATVLQHHGRAGNPDLQERVLSEASDAFDIHAFHQHGSFAEFQGAVDGELQRLRARMPQPRPLYFNETAISAAYIGEREQALTLVKKLVFAMSRGAIGYTWYDLRNDGDNPSDMEHNYGLLTSRFQPKAAFVAYQEAVRRLQVKRYRGALDFGPGIHAYVLGGPAGRTVVCWNERRDGANAPVLLRCGGGPVSLVDIMGASADVPLVDGMALIQPSAEPHYLALPPSADAPAVAGTLVRLALPSEVAPGQVIEASATLTNPLPRATGIRLAWRGAAGAAATNTVSVPAGGSANLPIAFRAAAVSANRTDVRLDFAVAGTPWSGTLRQSLDVVKRVVSQPPEERDPDWVLNTSDDMHSFCQADPALAAFLWKGADDLSARIWAWRQDDTLRLRVDVRDDVHVQREEAAMIWRADSVQVAFQAVGAAEGWEIGAARGADGQTLLHLWASPKSAAGAEVAFDVVCSAIPGGLRYEFVLPFAPFGLTEQVRRDGLRFNLIVNDNDGNLREGFARVAPGLGVIKDPALFPRLRVP